ncbi:MULTISPECIES: hypothetical protein [Subtercola]|uniref:Uncharacterized protein n=1 Tax=Subtercola vilae TaxID=2056433 RepID=A0A4T2BV69_9MICO|nr:MULTISPECIES: hypothetical protein [Subtercola]MEA9985950.1 hypothetical protein [Subtercola sp. RTI3]TIH35575.1 hypothetical protein D4765_10960 [Subtercola vilae]
MARRRRKRPVALPEFEELGTIIVPSIFNRERLAELAAAQKLFGGTIRARLVNDRVDGRRHVTVVLRYTSFRVTAGVLDDQLSRRFRSKICWLNAVNRVAVCEAQLVGDPTAPDYLTVWLNPPRDEHQQREHMARAGL